MPPVPMTTTVSPRSTLARLSTAPTPVSTPQPISAAEVSGMSVGDLHRLHGLDDGPLGEGGVGGELEQRLAPRENGCRGIPIALRHIVGRPRSHSAQAPQLASVDSATWSPGATWVTPAPTASTTPAPSCPSTTGTRERNGPVHDRQVAVAQPGGRRCATSTSPGPDPASPGRRRPGSACRRRRRLSISGSLGQAEHPLGDDVALDLVRAAVDGVGPGEQEQALCRVEFVRALARPVAGPGGAGGAPHLHRQLAEPLVPAAPQQLGDARGARRHRNRPGCAGRSSAWSAARPTAGRAGRAGPGRRPPRRRRRPATTRVQLRGEPDLLDQRGDAALHAEQPHGHPPAVALAADHMLGARAPSKKTSLNSLVPDICRIGRTSIAARLVHRHQQERQSVVAPRARLGPGEHEAPVGLLSERGPDLLPGDAVAAVAVPHGGGPHPGEVGARRRARCSPGTTVPRPGRRRAGSRRCCASVPVRDQGGGEQVLADVARRGPGRPARAYSSRPDDLLGEGRRAGCRSRLSLSSRGRSSRRAPAPAPRRGRPSAAHGCVRWASSQARASCAEGARPPRRTRSPCPLLGRRLERASPSVDRGAGARGERPAGASRVGPRLRRRRRRHRLQLRQHRHRIHPHRPRQEVRDPLRRPGPPPRTRPAAPSAGPRPRSSARRRVDLPGDLLSRARSLTAGRRPARPRPPARRSP